MSQLLKITSAPVTGVVKTFNPSSGADVNPTALGVVNLTGGNDIAVTGDAGTQTLTFDLAGTTEHAVQVGDATGGIESLAVGTDGQVLIGATAGDPAFATLTSSGGTITFTPGANTLNLEAVAGLPVIPDAYSNSFPTDAGTATPALHALTVAGGTNLNSAGSGSIVTLNLDADLAGISSLTTSTGGALRTGTTAADTLLLRAYDVDGTAYKTFATLTANNTPTMDLDTDVTIGTKYIYRADGTDVPVTDGGTGTSSLTQHGLLVGNDTSAISALAVGSTGQGLMGSTGAAPSWTGSPSFSGTVTAGTGLTTTTGNVAVTSGNISIPSTTSTVGQITQAGARILHSAGSTTRNLFVGNLAGNTSVTGIANTGIGCGSLQRLTSANSNTMIGEICGEDITSGAENSGLGQWTLGYLTTGARNTGFGHQAGLQLLTGNNNCFLGYQAGRNYTGSESSNIQISTKTSGIGTPGESNTIRIGASGAGAGEQNKTYIAGITGIAVGGAANVTLVDANGKLGTTAAGTVTLATGTNQLNVSADASATTVNIATGAAAKTVTLGSTNTTSKLDLKFGTADFSLASATGNVIVAQDTGEVTMPLQPAFLVCLNPVVTDVTGDGTDYAVVFNNEVWDNNSDFNPTTGVFTAPVTGKYFFNISLRLNELTSSHTTGLVDFVASSRTMRIYYGNPYVTAFSGTTALIQGNTLLDMTAGDTCYINVRISGGTKVVDIYNDVISTWFSGHLVC